MGQISVIMRRFAAVVAGALTLLVVTATPAFATIYEKVGYNYGGNELIRRAWLNYDSVNLVFRAYAQLEDAPGGGDYDVAVDYVKLQRSPDGFGWITVSTGDDPDDWWDTIDTGFSGLVGCVPGSYYRAYAGLRWRDSNGNVTSSEFPSYSIFGSDWCG